MKHRETRAIPLLLAACLLLAGYTGAVRRISDEPIPMIQLPPDEPAARQSLVLLVDSGADPLYREAAEVFSEKVLALTGDYLTVEVRAVADPAGEYAAGKGQLAFLDSRKSAELSPDFATLSAPMRYRETNSFTMGLNSRRMLDCLGEELIPLRNTRPLAAFYQGGSLLVTAAPVAGLLAAPQAEAPAAEPEDELPEEAEDEKESAPVLPLALLREEWGMRGLLEACGMRASVLPDSAARSRALREGDAVLAEFRYDELEAVEWGEGGPNIVELGHDMAPLWLVINDARYAGLPSRYRAAIQEAAAYLFPLIDGKIQEREGEIVRRAREKGATLERSFPALRAAADAAEQAEMAESARNKYLLGILTDMQ